MEAEERDLIRRAAALAVADGDARRLLEAELAHLAAVYRRDRELAGDPPRVVELRDRLDGRRHAVAGALAALELSRWERLVLEAGPGLPVLDGLGEWLGAYHEVLRFGVREMEAHVRHDADRLPGGPRWAFAWDLAGAWHAAGGHVGTAPAGRFMRFCGFMFAAVEEPLPDRMLRELVPRWQAYAGTVAAQPEKAPVAPLRQG